VNCDVDHLEGMTETVQEISAEPTGRGQRLHGHAHRYLPDARRDQPTAPQRAAPPGGPPGRRLGLSAHSIARRRDLKDEPGQEVVLDGLLDPLREPDATLGTVARRVGYGSPFALSTAFKRVRGVSPQEHRAGAPGN
jgi:hypothetical protein